MSNITKRLDRVLNQQLVEFGFSRLVKLHREGEYGVISAERYEMTPQDKKTAFRKLSYVVRQLGYGFKETYGTYTYDDGTQSHEKSIIVPGISKEELLHLAKMFNQESIIHSSDGKPRAFYADGSKADWSKKWKGLKLNPTGPAKSRLGKREFAYSESSNSARKDDHVDESLIRGNTVGNIAARINRFLESTVDESSTHKASDKS